MLPNEVAQTSRAGDDDVGAASQLVDLWAEPDAAVHGGDRRALATGEEPQLVSDLRGELARRHEDEAAGTACDSGCDAGDERNAERDRLARTGRRTAGHVSSGEGVRNRRPLDVGGVRDSPGIEPADHVGGRAQRSE